MVECLNDTLEQATIHLLDLGTWYLICSSLPVPMYLLNQDLFGRYGNQPNR